MKPLPGVSDDVQRWRLLPGAAFDTIAREWDELNEASFNSPLLTASFVRHLLVHFGSGGERIALRGTGDRLDAAMIVGPGGIAVSTFQPSQAPIGLWLQRAPRREAGEAGIPPLDVDALQALMPRLGAFNALLGLLQLDPDFTTRPSAGADCSRVMTGDYIQTARITVAGSFDAYWAARGKNLRSNMKKQRAKLEADGTVLRHAVVTQPNDVAAAITDYGRLEAAGWKAAGGTAVTPDNVQGRFYRALLEDYCARGAGRIYRYFYGDKVTAMDLCVAHGGTLVILKTAFDETIKGSSPALLMRHEYLPAIFEGREFDRIEFYGRVMDWHTKWTDEIRTLYHATVFRWAAAQRLYLWRQTRRADRPRAGAEDLAEAAASSKPLA